MTPQEITDEAINVLADHFNNGIEYSEVYERKDLEGADGEDLVKIHAKANMILDNLADALDNDELPASLYR